MPYATSAAPVRLHGLDTLRSLAILFVMLFHLQAFLPAPLLPLARVGWAGVDLFFVLSGFLIGWQLLKPLAAGHAPSFRTFYSRRAYRILPAYLLIVALYYAVPAWREGPGPSAAWQFLTFTWNLVLQGYPQQRAFSHVWSLCVEEHFYLALPTLLLILRRKPAFWTITTLAAIVLGGIALRGWLLFHVVLHGAAQPAPDDDQAWVAFMRFLYYPTYTRLDGLVTGVALALLRAFRPRWWTGIARHGHLTFLTGAALVGLALWSFQGDYPAPAVPVGVLIGFPTLAAGFGLLVVSAAADRSLLRVRIPGATALATLAYSLYLTHKSVVHVVRSLFPQQTPVGAWHALALYAVCCAAVASTLYFLVERPFLLLRTRRTEHRNARSPNLEARLDPAL